MLRSTRFLYPLIKNEIFKPTDKQEKIFVFSEQPIAGMASWSEQVTKELDKMAQKRKQVEDVADEKQKYKRQKIENLSYLFVYYDLEMCQGSIAGEIFQIGGKTATSEFSKHILPKGSIEWGVTQHFGGIRVKDDGRSQRQLVNKKTEFKTVDSSEAFEDFLKWVKEEKKCGAYDKVILIAHGDSDMPVLLNNVARDNLIDELKLSVDYFGNALKYFEQNFKDWNKYKLTSIYGRMFPDRKAFPAHDALEDSKALCDIIEKLRDGEKDVVKEILEHCFDVEKCCDIARKRVKKTLQKSATKKNRNSDPRCLKFCCI